MAEATENLVRPIAEVLSEARIPDLAPTKVGALRREMHEWLEARQEAVARLDSGSEDLERALSDEPELSGVSERRFRFFAEVIAQQNAANPADQKLSGLRSRAGLLWETLVALCTDNPDAALLTVNREQSEEIQRLRRDRGALQTKVLDLTERCEQLAQEREALTT